MRILLGIGFMQIGVPGTVSPDMVDGVHMGPVSLRHCIRPLLTSAHLVVFVPNRCAEYCMHV